VVKATTASPGVRPVPVAVKRVPAGPAAGATVSRSGAIDGASVMV